MTIQIGDVSPIPVPSRAIQRKGVLPDGRHCLYNIETGRIVEIFEPLIVCETDAQGRILHITTFRFSYSHHIEKRGLPTIPQPGNIVYDVTRVPMFMETAHLNLLGQYYTE